MARNNVETSVTFKVFNKEFNDAIKGMKDESSRLKQEFKLQEEQMRLTGTQTDKLNAKINYLQQEHALATRRVRETEEQLERVKQTFGENSTEAAQLASALTNARIAEQRFANQITTTRRELDSVTQGTRTLNTFFQATGRTVEDFSNVLGQRLVRSIQNGTASSRDLEQAFQRLSRDVLGAEGDIEQFRQSLNNVNNGNDLEAIRRDLQRIQDEAGEAEQSVSDFGGELQNVAGAIVAGGGIAGAIDQALDTSKLNRKIDITFEVPEESKQSVKSAIKTIETYGVDAEQALEGVRRQWALNKDASDEVNASIAKSAGVIVSNYDGIDFTELIQETNEIGASLGISNEEALGLVNSLLKTGFPPDQLDIIAEYGEQLSIAGFNAEDIQNIMAAGVDTKSWNIDNLLDGLKESKIGLSEFGLEVPKATKDLLKNTDISTKQLKKWGKAVAGGGKDGSQAMFEVAKALGGVEDATLRNELGVQIFGTKFEDQGMKLVDTLMNAEKGTADLGEGVKQLNEDVSKTDNDPFVKMNQAFVDIKTALEPTLTVIADVVSKIADWASQNPTLVATIATLTTGLGILIGIFMALAPVFITITGAAGLFNAAMLPTAAVIGGIVLAIGALIAIGVLLYKNWDEIKEQASVLWEGIKSFLSDTWNGIKDIAKNVWDGIKSLISEVWDGIKSVVSTSIEWVKTKITNIWNGIKSLTSSVWNGIKSVINGVWNGIKSAVSSSIDWVKTKITNIWNGIKSTTSSVWNGVKNVINGVWSGIKTGASSSVEWVKSKVVGVWDKIKTSTSSVWNGIKKAITDPIESAKNTVSGIIDTIKGFFEKLKLKIPTPSLPKLPHFSLTTSSKSIMGKTITYPTGFDIEWYAKGGYFDQPSVIGIGEAGPEMALPLIGKRMAPFADAVANRMLSSLPRMADNKMVQSTSNNNVTFNVTVRNDRDMDRLVDTIDKGMDFKVKRRKAAWGEE